GHGNGALRLHNGVWTLDPGAPPADHVTLEALGEAWTVGCSPPSAYHFVGGAWEYQDLPLGSVGFCVFSIALVPGRGGWAVGDLGTILQYQPLAPGQRFYDVPLSNPFALYIDYMAAHNIVSGYADNTFHPYSNITRRQFTKMVVSGMGWSVVTPISNTFADVVPTYPFYSFVETAAAHGVIGGYTCGAAGEPCDSNHRPYFRTQNDITRSQLTKIVVLAKGWGPLTPPTPTFVDVSVSDPFYGFVEQAAAKAILSGYNCGGPGESCPGTYFRPGISATRGQFSKILYLALTQP
ncbi:MAG TPA: S-layer homology domain-containing protein, partial [Chloroflexia bacterium]|nr:S-layer homology domain-containing protein [Chloroflexia bacterium]